MPLTSRSGESSGGYEIPTSVSGSTQVLVLDYPTALPASIVASGTWNSGLIVVNGYPKIMLAVLMDHGGTLTLHRFVDLPMTMERPVVTATIVANTQLFLDVGDGLVCLAMTVQIDNAIGAVGNISKFAIVLSN